MFLLLKPQTLLFTSKYMNWSKILLFALIFPFSFVVNGQSTDCPPISPIEQVALFQLYIATDGSNWTNKWDTSEPICNWYGVTVTDGAITGLNLADNNLKGTLPTWLCQLSSLETLALHDNDLEGEIPACIGDMTQLKTLNLSDNNFTDSIPASLYNLTNLISLSLNKNHLEGIISDSIGNLSSLITLNLSENNLSDTLPESLSNLEKLFVLDISYNNISGVIPDSLGNLSNLLYLSLNSNQLSGNIPENFANLTRLVHLDLGNNQLTGSIPIALTEIPLIRNIILSNNQITGAIPTFSQIDNLEGLCLDGNQLSGNIPATLSDIVYLNKLKLDNNLLEGELPETLSQLAFLEEFSASNNFLNGCFPESYILFCDNVIVNFNGNLDLPTDGDFAAFCSNPNNCQAREGLLFEIENADLDCYTGNRITINILQGTPSFFVQLEKDGIYLGHFPISNPYFQIQGMQAGTYNITITDANNYQLTQQLVISTDCQIVGDAVASSRSQSDIPSINLADLTVYNAEVEVFDSYPNPFTVGTRLPFSISTTQDLNIRIVNATGQQVYQLAQTFEAGNHQLHLEENIFTQAGLYIYHVQYGDKLISGKLLKL